MRRNLLSSEIMRSKEKSRKMVRRRTFRNTRRRGRAPVRQVVRAEHRSNDGHKIVPRITPPQFTRLPWNDFTFTETYKTLATSDNFISVTVGSIRRQIVDRMGLNGAPGTLALKVISGAAWNISTGNGFTEPFIKGLFYEITPAASTYAFRSDQQDNGTLQRAARVGYMYPLRDRKEILTNTEENYVLASFRTQPNQESGNITIRFKVLWLCTNDSSALRSRDDDHDVELVQDLEPLPF